MIEKLIPNTLIYLFNYLKYKFLYKNSQISPRSFLYQVKLGKNNVICGGNYLHNCQLGDYTYISGTEGGGIVSGYNNVTIGKYCSLANNIEIITASSHNKNFISTFPFYSMPHSFCFSKEKSLKFTKIKPVNMGNDIWIGSRVVILGGVAIGNGAIIGAGSVVTKDVPPYAIVAGSPAKIISYRFSSEVIDKLLAIEWWDWPEEKIKKSMSLLTTEKIEEFIKTHEK